MAKRRPSGDGMVRKREDGRWEGRIVVGHKDNGDSIFRYLRLYISPGLGHIPLNRLTAKDTQRFFAWLKTEGRADQSDGETGLADSQLRNIHSLCWRALEKAVSGNLIPQNPASGCKLPPARKGEMNLLSRESMQKPLIQAKEEKYYELFLLEFATGLRLGELTALQWEDLNLTTGELRISKQVVVIGSELVITEPKTKAAVRTLLLPPKVLEVFREYRNGNPSRWLFPSPKKEDSPLLPSVVRQRLHRLLDHAGCERVRFHDLRHPYVKHTTKNKSLQKQKSQTIKQADSLGFALLLLLILKGAGCVELKKHFSFSISPYE